MSDDPIAGLRRPVENLEADPMMSALRRQSWCGRQVPAIGSCVVLARLGAGGMGAVYFGFHPRLHREVAIKFLPLTFLADPVKCERFEREARVAARISSPHLVQVHDVGDERGMLYMIMEYVHGCSAGYWMRLVKAAQKSPITEREVLTLGLAAARGLTVAHAQHVVHRDIKPDNIFIPFTPDLCCDLGGAKLGDLGLAVGHSDHTLTESFSTMGTPGYMAPEQAMNAKTAGPAADVFSVGATLYTLLVGRTPFSGSTHMEVVMNTMQGEPVPIVSLRPDISPSVQALIAACLARDPDARPRDGAVLVDRLNACLAALPPGAAAAPLSSAVADSVFSTMVLHPRRQTTAPSQDETLPTPPLAAPPAPPPAPLEPTVRLAPDPPSPAVTPPAPVAAAVTPAALTARSRRLSYALPAFLGAVLLCQLLLPWALGPWYPLIQLLHHLGHLLVWPFTHLRAGGQTAAVGGLLLPLLSVAAAGIWAWRRRSLPIALLAVSATAALLHYHRLYLHDLNAPDHTLMAVLEFWQRGQDRLHDWNQLFMVRPGLWDITNPAQRLMRVLSVCLHVLALAGGVAWSWRRRRRHADTEKP